MSGEAGGVKPDRDAVLHGGNSVGVTEDALLDGRVRFRQFQHGFRSGFEAVLLAATVAGRRDARLLDAGCGTGAALLCAGARLPGMMGVGIERDPDTAALARENLHRNALEGWVVFAGALNEVGAGLPERSFDHVVSNPPWHRENATMSPSPRRDLARRAPGGMLGEWCGTLARLLRHRGTISLALPAAQHGAAAAALRGGGFGAVTLLPLWPAAGREAKLVLVGARRGARGPDRVLPGLVLHGADGRFTTAAEAVLRGGEALPMFDPP